MHVNYTESYFGNSIIQILPSFSQIQRSQGYAIDMGVFACQLYVSKKLKT